MNIPNPKFNVGEEIISYDSKAVIVNRRLVWVYDITYIGGTGLAINLMETQLDSVEEQDSTDEI